MNYAITYSVLRAYCPLTATDQKPTRQTRRGHRIMCQVDKTDRRGWVGGDRRKKKKINGDP